MNKTKQLINALEILQIMWPDDEIVAIERNGSSGKQFHVTWEGKESVLIDFTNLYSHQKLIQSKFGGY